MKRIGILRVLVCMGLILPMMASGGIKRIKTDRKVVALTFDDGPGSLYTDELLSILADKKVKATFFLIGSQIDQHPEVAQNIIKAGHEVGGHSNGWKSLAFRKRVYVEDQLDKMDLAFAHIGITNLTLFRPPNGFLSPGQGKILTERGLQHISADVVVGDWKSVSAETIKKRVIKKVRPGSIIVLHDGGGDRSSTIAAVPAIIDELRKQGYSFLPVGELLLLK